MDKSKFVLDLTADGNFACTLTQKSNTQTVKEVYALDGNVLAMEPESGGNMLAKLSQPEGESFGFQLLGTPPASDLSRVYGAGVIQIVEHRNAVWPYHLLFEMPATSPAGFGRRSIRLFRQFGKSIHQAQVLDDIRYRPGNLDVA